jgi:hypothetical protein
MDCKLAFTRTKTGFHGDCLGCAWGSGVPDKRGIIETWEKWHGITFVPSEHLASVIILSPMSETNRTTGFQVVRYLDWISHINRETISYPVISAHSSYMDAARMRDSINASE